MAAGRPYGGNVNAISNRTRSRGGTEGLNPMARRPRVTPTTSLWLSTREAARQSGLSVFTLRNWVRRRLVPRQYLTVTPGGYLFHRDFAARPQPLSIAPAEVSECEQPTQPDGSPRAVLGRLDCGGLPR